MKRFQDWPERLAEFIRSRESTPFDWPRHNCGLFACDAVMEMTGVDLAAAFRGHITGRFSAYRAVRDYCGGGLEELAERIAADNSLPEVPPKTARRGDIVLVPHGETSVALAVVAGVCAVVPGPLSVTELPPDQWLRAWRIG